VRKKTRRWQSMLAGSVAGGLAIMFEKKGNRIGVAQQMFVRGLQGSYNAFSSKHGIHFPHGDVLVFFPVLRSNHVWLSYGSRYASTIIY